MVAQYLEDMVFRGVLGVLLHFNKKTRDIMVVQHSGGHGIQGVLEVLLYLNKYEGKNCGTVLGGTWYSGGGGELLGV